jgi:hypothetical protein
MAMTAAQRAYLQLNSTAIADSFSGSKATFLNKTIATPPEDFSKAKKDHFGVYLNNRRLPGEYVDSIYQVGANIEVTVDIASFLGIPGAEIEEGDEILLTGKFS